MTASTSTTETARLMTPFYAEELAWAENRHPIPVACTKALAEFIPTVSPHYGTPHHLAQLLDVFDRIDRGEEVRALISVPPQHGKSETGLHGLARIMGRRPGVRNAFCTYASDFARAQSRKVRRLIREMGMEISREANRQEGWETTTGSSLQATGVDGPLTGKGVDGILIIDDPYKNRVDAESAAYREKVWEWYLDVAETRISGNASIIIIHTRWHPDDLIGRLLKFEEWEHINIPAVSEVDGVRTALLPAYPGGKKAWPLEKLDKWRAKRGEYGWWSVFMGEPRPKGGHLFEIGATCESRDIPSFGRVAIGVDLAYSKKTRSNWSVAVVLREVQNLGGDCAQYPNLYYVEHVERHQVKAPVFVRILSQLSARYPGAPMWWHGSPQEQGAAEVIQDLGLRQLEGKRAIGDPYIRAQPAAAKWNAKKIITASDCSWSSEFLIEHQAFTGVGDKFDDQVVALASALEALDGAPTSVGATEAHDYESDRIGGLWD